jgi:ribosomal protein S27AE
MGNKKHKKKIYTTPKVIAHKHKSIPLASLNFFDIQENNTLISKKFCPNTDCGSGTYMASHNDRYYCGKCHLTISK